MDSAAARRLLAETLERPFDEAQFRQLAQNLLNTIDETKAFTAQGGYIKDAYKEQVQQYKRIGQYTDPDGNVIDILWVRLKRATSLDRARTMQRNFVAQYLQDRGEKDAALVAYSADDAQDWRFSFVQVEYRLEQKEDGTFKPKKEVTAARRSSFLVGSKPIHTAQQQLLPVLKEDRRNPTLAEIEAVFSVEAVTKEFFEQYKKLFLQVKEELAVLVEEDTVIAADFEAKQVDVANFAKKLLGQIVFLYFLQKKGWLGVAVGDSWGNGPKNFLRQLFEGKGYSNFFNDVLEPLFYEALALDRGTEAKYQPIGSVECKIPFLNGGLFEPIGGYDWQKTEVLLRNETVAEILKTFDLYNFTVREDEPLDKEVAVDPEMLGKVFENLLEVTDRKSKGAFYTPREIVHYMCQESLINYLDTAINVQAVEVAPPATKQASLFAEKPSGQLLITRDEYVERVPRQELEQLVRRGEIAIENDMIALNKQQSIEAGDIKTTKYNFRLPELVRLHATEIDSALANIKICDPAIGSGAFPVGMMQEIVKVRKILTSYDTLSGEERTAYNFKRHAIQSSIYGVDIDAGAVDIAKLRLWLSLVVDEESYESIKPLPNLDYKIVCGNSLVGVESAEEIADYQANMLTYPLYEELKQLQDRHFEETKPVKKAALDSGIKRIIKELTGSEETFDFRVYFSDVFRNRKGFDVVIGNPPYVRQEQIKEFKERLKKQYECYTGTADLYVFFYEKGIKILREQGVLAYISSNKYFRAGYGKKLRKFLAEETRILDVIDFGDAPVFEAIAYPTIVITARGKEEDSQATVSQQLKALVWEDGQPLANFEETVEAQSFAMPQSALNETGWQFIDADSLALLEQLRKAGTPLGEYVDNHFYRGILTGFNEAFIVPKKKRDELIAEHPSSAEVLKPFLKGRDVKRWKTEDSSQWLLFIPWHFPLHEDDDIKGASAAAEAALKERYPAIYNHLLSYKKQLSSRNRSETGIRYEWYALQRCAATYWQEFEKNKIIYPDIAKNCEFSFDSKGIYPDCTLFMIPEVSVYLVGILNSTLIQFFFSQISPRVRGDFMRFKSIYVKQIPIANPSENEKRLVEKLSSYILYTSEQQRERSSKDSNLTQISKDKLMSRYFEQIIDAVVIELYLPKELHAHNRYFIRDLLLENLPSINKIKGAEMQSLRSIFDLLYEKSHPVREGIFFLDSIPVVRIIRGLA